MQSWEFLQDGQAGWYWRCTRDDGTAIDSDERFETRTDCIADAMRWGYLSTGGTWWAVDRKGSSRADASM